jgi:hypothetical protein
MCREVRANSAWAYDEDWRSPWEGGRQQRRRGARLASLPSHASVARDSCACLGGRVKLMKLMKLMKRLISRVKLMKLMKRLISRVKLMKLMKRLE